MKKTSLAILLALSASSIQAQDIGSVVSKGFLSRDSITVKSFNDPDISGVTCYTTRYKRGMSFNDSTNSSLSCRQTGPIDTTKLSFRQRVFTQQKGGLFLSKETLVDRMIDKVRNVIVYLSYTKSIGSKNSSHSLSVVPIKKWK